MMRIGELAKGAGVNVQTLRFYEREGLFPKPPLGLRLRASNALARMSLRRTHFWTMLAIVVLVAAHVARNRP